jgi:Flp pilus assembly protein TadD
LSWQNVVIGDPLCRPFAGPTATSESLDPGLDPVSEMPREYSRRWIAVAQEDAPETGGALRSDGLRLALKGQARLAKDDRPGALAALIEATSLEPRLNGTQFLLASMYEEAGEFDKSADRYRRILANKNSDVLALNNLAFHLATREHKPADALPLAERAYVLSRAEPNVTDTLAWVYHLLGNERDAIRYINEAIARGPKIAETRVHSAAIYAAAGDVAAARKELQTALQLNPGLAARDDVKALQEKLNAAPPR